VKISFSQRYVLITFLFRNLIKQFLNNFVYTVYRILLMLNSHCIYACFGSMHEHDLQSDIEIFRSKLYIFTRKLK
jgi:hypothetical protein